MKVYPKYKPSNIEWIGEIADTWNTIQIKRLSQVKRGASPRPIDDPKYFDDNGEFAWVRISDVSASNKYLENTTQKLSNVGASLSVKQYPGDIFLSIAGTVGKPIISKIKCCIHDGFVWFPNLNINPEFLYYIFSTGEPYYGLGKWGTQLNLNTETVGYISIPLPSNELEINSIVKYLNDRTQKIDTLIEKKQKLIDLLKEERTATINQAITKGLNPDVPMKDSGIEWVGEIPKHWEVKKLKWVCSFFYGNSLSNEDRIGGNTPIYGSNGIVGYHNLAITRKPCIIIGRKGSFGKINYSESECFPIDTTYFVDGAATKNNIRWLYFALQTLNLDSLSKDTGVPGLSREDAYYRLIIVPSFEEQQSIGHYLDDHTKKIDTLIEKMHKLIDLLKEERDALISEVVTGKIDVREAI